MCSRQAPRKTGKVFKSKSVISSDDDDEEDEEDEDEDEEENESAPPSGAEGPSDDGEEDEVVKSVDEDETEEEEDDDAEEVVEKRKTPTEETMVKLTKSILRVKEAAKLGFANWHFAPTVEVGRRQPKMLTQQLNPRGTSKAELDRFEAQVTGTVGGLKRNSIEFAMVVLINPDWILNLEEMLEWAPLSNKPVEIVWADGAGEAAATMCNGFHRYLLLLRLIQRKYDQRADLLLLREDFLTLGSPTAEDEKLKAEADTTIPKLDAWLKKNGSFLVLFYDQSELSPPTEIGFGSNLRSQQLSSRSPATAVGSSSTCPAMCQRRERSTPPPRLSSTAYAPLSTRPTTRSHPTNFT